MTCSARATTVAGTGGCGRPSARDRPVAPAPTACAAGSSITMASRTTPASRSRSPGRPWPRTRVRGGHPAPGDGLRGPAESKARPGVVRATDLATGAELEIRTRAVVDATGVWAADPDHPFAGRIDAAILPSRGAHLVVPRERIPASAGLTIRVPGKVVFLVPWPDHWLIGTTDAPLRRPPDRPAADGWEIDELLATVNDDPRRRPPAAATSSARTPACGRSSPRPAARRSRRRASTG